MWTVKQHHTFKLQQDLKVSILVKEMAQNTYATDAASLEEVFKGLLGTIKKKNNFDATLMYRLSQRNEKSTEVWKLYPNGDFKMKMFTLDYQAQ